MRSIIANSALLQNTLVPDDLALDNVTISAGQTDLYDVAHTMDVTNLTVQTGGDLTLRAGDRITIDPGSFIEGKFIATIDGQCNTIDYQNSAKTDDTARQNNETVNELAEEAEYDLKIYPNPAAGIFTISGTDMQHINILTATGKLVREISPTGNAVQVNGLSSGLYIVRAQMADGSVENGKVVVN